MTKLNNEPQAADGNGKELTEQSSIQDARPNCLDSDLYALNRYDGSEGPVPLGFNINLSSLISALSTIATMFLGDSIRCQHWASEMALVSEA